MARPTRPMLAVMLPLLAAALPLAAAAPLVAAPPSEADAATQAKQILEATGVRGGLVVHLGSGDGRLTAALAAGPHYLAHGLDRDADDVTAAREYVRDLGRYGQVSIEARRGDRLPYTDNLVNLIVAEQAELASVAEIDRVLAPGGVAYIRDGDDWQKRVKPRPDAIDEWTHFLHGPDNNAVARDTVVGPPHHVQWIGGPRWARGHEVLASISAVVSASGRVFYIADEGPIASIELPSKWVLAGRDAFNGLLLWKRPIPKWESRHRPFRSGPTHLPRRLVAVGQRVYVTLGLGEPVVALDAASGEVIQTYAGTEGTEEIVVVGERLFLVLGDRSDQEAVDAAIRRGQTPPNVTRAIVSLDIASGNEVWRLDDDETADLFSQTLAVSGERVYFQNTRAIVAVDAASGSRLWRTQRPASLARPAWSVPTLVVHGDVVLSADRRGPEEAADDSKPQKVKWTVSFQGGQSPPGEMVALAAASGKELWKGPCREGYNAPVDLLLADGLLWTGELVKAKDPGITAALDPATGKVERERPKDQEFFTPGMSHHRCYRNRATERFILLGRSGVELLDVKTGKAEANHWIRGTCQFGVLPANGLIYVPPHSCACYLKTKLNGFNALAPRRPVETAPPSPRLEKGPAWRGAAESERAAAEPVAADPGDWPTYRHDPLRSGATDVELPADLEPAWQTELGGELTSVVVAGGKLFVARRDTHTLHALGAVDGKPAWSFTAGGPIDSPPTVYDGQVLFGSADGWLYSLRASDGALAWRFRAGPEDRRVVVDGGLESAWPLHGSPLLHEGRVYFTAGRSSFLDGGIHLCALDPASGAVLHETLFSGRDPETGEQPRGIVKGFDMPGGLPDVLSSDGTSIYMRDVRFDAECVHQETSDTHLFSPTGFLDDSWWHRSYFVFGTSFKSGWGGWSQVGNQVPAGRLVVIDDDAIYGYGLNVYPRGNAGQWRSGEYYRLFAAGRDLKQAAPQPAAPQPTPKQKRRGKRPAAKSQVDYRWQQKVELAVRALVLAGETLLIAGPQGETHRSPAAFEGREGITLQMVAAADGTVRATHQLDSLPVYDGLAVAQRRLYLSTRDGKVRCFAGK